MLVDFFLAAERMVQSGSHRLNGFRIASVPLGWHRHYCSRGATTVPGCEAKVTRKRSTVQQRTAW